MSMTVAALFVEKNGTYWDLPGVDAWDQERDAFADRCFDLLNDYAPNFKRSVLARQVLTPPDLERIVEPAGGAIVCSDEADGG